MCRYYLNTSATGQQGPTIFSCIGFTISSRRKLSKWSSTLNTLRARQWMGIQLKSSRDQISDCMLFLATLPFTVDEWLQCLVPEFSWDSFQGSLTTSDTHLMWSRQGYLGISWMAGLAGPYYWYIPLSIGNAVYIHSLFEAASLIVSTQGIGQKGWVSSLNLRTNPHSSIYKLKGMILLLGGHGPIVSLAY